jgi:hypothetical protein
MRSGPILSPLAAVGLWWLAASAAPAQQVTVTTPLYGVSDSFFERTGTHWGFDWGGFHVTFGGPNMAMPPFGNFDPNAGINGGFAVHGNGLNGFFNFAAAQGYRQSFVTQAPSLTLTNGYPGYVADITQSPFVVGLIPVVGGFADGFPIGPWPYYTTGYPVLPGSAAMQPGIQGNPRVQAMLRQLAAGNQGVGSATPPPRAAGIAGGGPAPRRAAGRPNGGGPDLTGPPAATQIDPSVKRLAAAQSSSAGRAVPSVAEARRMHEREQAARHEEALVYYEKALTAEEGGKPGVAKAYYHMALGRAQGEVRDRILARLKALGAADTP